MNWGDLKRGARDAAHGAFKRFATYTAPAPGATPVNCDVRLYGRVRTFGDNDREGYAQVVDEVEKVQFDLAQIAAPARLGVVKLYSNVERTSFLAEFTVDTVVPSDDGAYQLAHVTRNYQAP